MKPGNVADGLPCYHLSVAPDWIDGNRHVNACYYQVAVKDPAIAAHDEWGYGQAFRDWTGETSFVTESHTRHFRELKAGARLCVTTRVVDLDDKRLHLLFEVHSADETYLAAIVEYITIHVRMSPPRAQPFPADLHARLHRLKELHETIPASPLAFPLRLSVHSRQALARHGGS